MQDWNVSKINDMELKNYIAGITTIPHFAGSSDGYLLEYNNISGFCLYVLLNNPSKTEEDCITYSGNYTVSFAEIYGCGIFSFKFAQLEWGDCFFEPRKYDNKLDFPILDAGMGLAVNIMLIDPSKNGLVVGMRIISLGHDFSNYVINWCKKKAELPFDEAEWLNQIEHIYNNLSPKDIVKRSDVMWKVVK